MALCIQLIPKPNQPKPKIKPYLAACFLSVAFILAINSTGKEINGINQILNGL
jgi:hypothetical protein